jgi:hypothetical protein
MSWKKLRSLNKADQFGAVSAGFGFLQQGIGAYYAASAEKYKTKSLALSLEHKRDMMLFNQRMAESQVFHIYKAHNSRIQASTLKAGAKKSTAKTMFAARGIQMGVGSTKDAFVSDEILKEIDKITMNSNRARAASNKRLEAVGMGIQASGYGLSASNAFATASNISPFMNMGSSLLTGAGDLVASLPKELFK